jgi:SAM-dependent methyltransferase
LNRGARRSGPANGEIRVPEGPAGRELSLTFSVALPPAEAFPLLLQELTDALHRLGVEAELGPNGRVVHRGISVGAVIGWEPGRAVRIKWDTAPWDEAGPLEIGIRCTPEPAGTRVGWEVRGCDQPVKDSGGELLGWITSSLLAPSLMALTPASFGDWLTDRRARRPSGRLSEATYRDPTYHWPNFLLILDRVGLAPTDRLLEVGCGAGAFLGRALESGCSAVAIDHSPEMVRQARELNRESIARGRAEILEAEADRLPVPDEEFSWVISTGAFGFFPDPEAVLREMGRALRPGGRLAIFSGTAALRGTPACPEPMASRIHFYDDDELREMAERAGFADVRVEQPSMRAYAERARVPPEGMALFEVSSGAQLLLARKPG